MMLATLEQTTTARAEAPAQLRILLADDNEILGATIGGLLQSLGHSVEVVSNGREAVESAAREDFHVVFLDIQMPEMGGFEAARWIRHENAGGQPCWIIGFSGESPDHKLYAASGMDDFLLKPVRLVDLVRALRYHLAS
jgi:CheY-like chemotaxis protein